MRVHSTHVPFDPKSWIDREAYPFAPHYFEAGSGRMHYVDEGQGAPVLMLHGNPTWSFLYRHLIRRLAPAYRCVAPDYLGFGLSDKPPGWSYAPPAHAICVHDLIEHFGLEDVTLVVHDWGGPIGLSYALRRPENVRALVVMNTWLWPLNRDPKVMAFSTLMGGPLGRMLTRRFNAFARYVMPLVYGDPRRLIADVHRHYLKPAARPEEREGHWVFARALLGAAPWLEGLWRQREKLVGLPALLLWGMKDPAFGGALKRWQRVLPGAQVRPLSRTGHYVPEEAGNEAAERVARFLDTLA